MVVLMMNYETAVVEYVLLASLLVASNVVL